MADPCVELIENAAAEKRVSLSTDALCKVVGGSREDMPRIGMCLSGGGWRAMTSACALFDALSVPFKSTVSGEPVKPLDCFSHAFGLSGGSWMLFNTLLGASVGCNPFHDTADNPWLFGPDHRFDEAKHRYQGLKRMVDKDVVDTACYRSSFRKNVGFLSAKAGADATIAAVLSSKDLGPTLVERWSNFIASDLLGWLDAKLPVPSQEELSKQVEAEVAAWRLAMTQKVEYQFLTPEGKQKADKKLAEEEGYLRELLLKAKYPSHRARFSSLQQAARSGSLPFVVCAAIANKNVSESVRAEYERFKEEYEDAVSEATPPGPLDGFAPAPTANPSVLNHNQLGQERKVFPRIYDWVEFTPFFIRNPSSGIFYTTVNEAKVKFDDGDTPQKELYLHYIMGICGSAFACDMSCALPTGIQRSVTKHRELNTKPLIGRGTSTVSSEASGHPPLGEMRDAGIDFNIPLPPMLKESSGRSFDIIVVMDAGSGSRNAHELQRAIDLGYLEPMILNPEKQFPKGHYVQVYKNNTGGPIIIYLIGLTERGTHQIICEERLLLHETQRLRDRVLKQLVPVLAAEMRNVARRKARLRQAAVNRSMGTGAAIEADESATMDVINEDAEVDDEEDALPEEDLVSPDVRTLMLAAAATGAVHNGYDAFAAAESNILWDNGFIQAQTRGQSVAIVEATALTQLLNPGSANQLDRMPKVVYDELVKFGVLVPSGKKRTLFSHAKRLAMRMGDRVVAEPWRDYYAATTLACTLLKSNPALLGAIHRGEAVPTCMVPISGFPLHLPSRVWGHLANCIKAAVSRVPGTETVLSQFTSQVFESFEKFLGQRQQYSDAEKVQGLRNFAIATSDLGINDQLMALLARQSLTPGEYLAVAQEAARCGNVDVLLQLARVDPQYVDQPAVLASAYASGDDQLIAWLRNDRHVALDFVSACANGWYEAVNELIRLPENQNNGNAALAALEAGSEPIATLLFNKGNRGFRVWLATEVQNRGLPWERLLQRAGLPPRAQAVATSDRGLAPPSEQSSLSSKAHDAADKAKEAAEAAKLRAAGGIKAAAAFGKGLFGKK